jgi:hypothetical protein
MLPIDVVRGSDPEQGRLREAGEPLAVRVDEEEPTVADRALPAEVDRVGMDQRGRLHRREVEPFDDGHGPHPIRGPTTRGYHQAASGPYPCHVPFEETA